MYKKMIKKSIKEAKVERNKLEHVPGVKAGIINPSDKGFYLINYANCLVNRQLDIFDDSLMLLEKGRIQSACVLSRGMIETHAFARILNKKIEKILTEQRELESVDNALNVLMKYINSSRFKETEQKKIKKGIFDPNDYMFTEETKYRFENMLAGSEHVMDALRDLYKDEMEQTKQKESHFEQVYDILSEWVHPSQTSIYHYYVPETHLVPTSIGMVHVHYSASLHCARALHFIVDTKNQYNWSLMLAEEMNKRGLAK